jgi:hypothetical protein
MHLNEAFRDREAKSGSAFAPRGGAVHLLKLVEYPVMVVEGDSRSSVANAELDPLTQDSEGDLDRALIRELHRIAEKIE